METALTVDATCIDACSDAGFDVAINTIDWSVPWLTELRELAAPILTAADWRNGLNRQAEAQSLRNHRGLPIQFVPQAELPADTPYEAFISDTGRVPTRANLHDFFNALVWLAYPQVKRQLNALQAAEIIKSAATTDPGGAPGSSANLRANLRGKLRDGATIFDENAALFVSADQKLTAALQTHRWNDLFVVRRTAFGSACQVRLFGHALMEKLVAPYKAITAHEWVVSVKSDFFQASPSEQRAQLDAMLARQLAPGLTTADFTPLPVLGIPDWWPQQNEAFYADQFVFRPQRKARHT